MKEQKEPVPVVEEKTVSPIDHDRDIMLVRWVAHELGWFTAGAFLAFLFAAVVTTSIVLMVLSFVLR